MWTRVLSKVKNLTPTKGGSKKKGGGDLWWGFLSSTRVAICIIKVKVPQQHPPSDSMRQSEKTGFYLRKRLSIIFHPPPPSRHSRVCFTPQRKFNGLFSNKNKSPKIRETRIVIIFYFLTKNTLALVFLFCIVMLCVASSSESVPKRYGQMELQGHFIFTLWSSQKEDQRTSDSGTLFSKNSEINTIEREGHVTVSSATLKNRSTSKGQTSAQTFKNKQKGHFWCATVTIVELELFTHVCYRVSKQMASHYQEG